MTRALLCSALLALPALAGEPAWTLSLDVSGRPFVSDQALLLAADVAKPSHAPATKAPPEVAPWAAASLKEKLKEKAPLSTLKKDGAHYLAASGMQLGGDYVDFLSSRVGAKHLAFGFRGSCQPVVVLVKGVPSGLLMPLNVPGAAVEAPPEPQWSAVARLPDGTRFLLDKSFVFSEAQLGELPSRNAGVPLLPEENVQQVVAWMGARVKQPFHLSDLRCGSSKDTYEGPGGVLLNARYVDFLRARVDLWPLAFHSTGPLEPIALVMKGRGTGVLMPMKP
ncbi:MAG: hypothetical protein IT380_01180 [Myxococcales bacterium]|nr:hypothetical protein [Myxococcales bacterium]